MLTVIVAVLIGCVIGWLIGVGLLPTITVWPRRPNRDRMPRWCLVVFVAHASWLNGRGRGRGYTPFDAIARAIGSLYHTMRHYPEAWYDWR